MRALANYIMQGRLQAVLIAAFTTGSVLLAWVGAAAVALVTLRKGSSEGSQVLFWALLPALVLAVWGDTGPVTTLIGVTLAAMVLRNSSSWPLALVAATVSGLVTGFLLVTLGQGYLEEILNLFTAFIEQVNSQSAEQGQAPIGVPGTAVIAGLLGLSNAFAVAMCLLLARWWQSILYNPGGFRVEFHQLRMPPMLTIFLIVAGLLLSALGTDYRLWALIVIVPLGVAGLGLVHGLVALKGKSSNVLVIFYIALFLLHPLKIILIVAAVLDSWINFRARITSRKV